MKWLIDEVLPPTTADELAILGHDAISVAGAQLLGADDAEVFAFAVDEQRIIVTENFADFVALVDEWQANDRPCTPVVFVRKSAFASGGSLPSKLAAHLDSWATANPEPYVGIHWP